MDVLSTLFQQRQHLSETKYYGVKFSGDWAYSIKSSNAIYFYLVQAGSCCISIGGATRKMYAGDVVMIANGDKHVCYALDYHGDEAKPLDRISLNCNQDIITVSEESTLNVQLILVECQYDKDPLLPLLSALPAILPEDNDSHKSQPKAFDVAVKFITLESECERLGKLAMINLWVNIVMIECLRTYIESLPETSDSWLIAMREPYLSKVLILMHDKPDYSWTTHELAKEAGMSRSSFSQRFRETVGTPPLTYLTDYRLRLAASHLRLRQNNIGQISEMVGYASNSTFSQAFKRVYGMSPKAYQQQKVVTRI